MFCLPLIHRILSAVLSSIILGLVVSPIIHPMSFHSGTLGDTGILPIPRGSLELQFRHKNLGILTSLRIGHDNSGMAPRCQLEHVLVRNEITGGILRRFVFGFQSGFYLVNCFVMALTSLIYFLIDLF